MRRIRNMHTDGVGSKLGRWVRVTKGQDSNHTTMAGPGHMAMRTGIATATNTPIVG
jgi:hypothetical protein